MPSIQPNPNELYSPILKSLGYVVTPTGEVYLHSDDMANSDIEHLKVHCGTRQLVLPFDENLRRAEWSSKIPFHPLSENTYRGESEIIKFMRSSVVLRLTELMSVLIESLVTIGANPNTHKTLAASLKPLLQKIPDADPVFLKSIGKILSSTELSGENMLVHIYLKRGGVLKGVTYSRAAIVSFPILDQIEKGTNEIFGVSIRKKDIPTMRGLMDFILSDHNDPNEEYSDVYSHGSHDLYAPYFDALMGSYHKLGAHLSALLYRYRKYVPKIEQVQPDFAWYECMNDLSRYRGVIPVLPDNEGDIIDAEGNVIETTVTYKEIPPPQVAPVATVETMMSTSVASPVASVAPVTVNNIAAPLDSSHSPQVTNVTAPINATYDDAAFERALIESGQPSYGMQPQQQQAYVPGGVIMPPAYGSPYGSAYQAQPKSYHQATPTPPAGVQQPQRSPSGYGI